jgi:hypothetical protein
LKFVIHKPLLIIKNIYFTVSQATLGSVARELHFELVIARNRQGTTTCNVRGTNIRGAKEDSRERVNMQREGHHLWEWNERSNID